MEKPLLLGCKGCGNAIVEAAFAVAAIPVDTEEVDYSDASPTRPRLLKLNPLGQVPTLVLPSGEVMTESLAMLHYIDDVAPKAGLIPPKGDPLRPAFYRWAVFLIAAVYPTYTYGDDPKKWVPDEAASKLLRESTDNHRKTMWGWIEAEAKGPWFLGDRFSALDLYIAAMTRWRPGVLWFAKNTPKCVAIAKRAAALDAVAPVIRKNFD
jgi:GST-like protein